MDKSIKDLITQLTTPQPLTTGQKIEQVIGAAIFGGGLLGALNASNQIKGYPTPKLDLVSPSVTESTSAGFDTALGGYTAGEMGRVESGMKARGITDNRAIEQAKTGLQGSLSGAYASARSALARAKASAGNAVSSALANYQMGLAQKQYDALMANYQGKLGIWGALGGLGGSMIKENK